MVERKKKVAEDSAIAKMRRRMGVGGKKSTGSDPFAAFGVGKK